MNEERKKDAIESIKSQLEKIEARKFVGTEIKIIFDRKETNNFKNVSNKNVAAYYGYEVEEEE